MNGENSMDTYSGGTRIDDNVIPRDSQNNSLVTSTTTTTDSSKCVQHGCCLTLSDHDRLRVFVHEFIVRGLMPWAERTMRTLSEQVRNMYVLIKEVLYEIHTFLSPIMGKCP